MTARPGPTQGPRRPWAWLVGAVLVIFLAVMALGMWSEREDARRLPAEEVDRRGEEPWRPEPIDSPALPNP
jgi:uncharacterized iron-regulated membrane protein